MKYTLGKFSCVMCDSPVNRQRWDLGYHWCKPCGEKVANERRYTVVPMHKSNYILVTNREDLKGINNKGGFYR